MAKHKHHDIIVAWAADPSQPFEWRDQNAVFEIDRTRWSALNGVPMWDETIEFRIKPAPPEFPASTISEDALSAVWVLHRQGGHIQAARAIADASVRHEYETGTAVPKAEHEAALARLGEQLRDVSASAIRTLTSLGYTDCGGELWKPPLGPSPPFVDAEREMNIVNLGTIYGSKKALGYVANAILDPAPARRLARDLAIAKAVQNAAWVARPPLTYETGPDMSAHDYQQSWMYRLNALDLQAIIASVK